MNIEQLAREVGALPGNAHNDALAYSSNQVAAIIGLVHAAAMEEAAQACKTAGELATGMYGDGAECIATAELCVEAIRALTSARP